MSPPEIIQLLTQRFEDNLPSYRSGQYNETQLRREFLDPFFEALGWDVFNKHGYAEAYKDVVHEDAIKVGGGTRAPDYAFRIGGTRKFFVEAKKPSVNIKEDISPAFQLRRYAWSAKLPLSILTDFEEFAVYDCRSKPDRSDKVSTGRLMMLNYPDYLEKWDEIAAIFSREAVLKGSFDRYAETTKGKHGTSEVDDAFLAEIEHWRELLAHNIALRNTQLSSRELNFAVQMTIDRIIFLRIAEDRGIEPYGTLLSLVNGAEIYSRLGQHFRKADERYNSGLFHFREEKETLKVSKTFRVSSEVDDLTLNLALDDKPLKDILSHLYYPDSPYEFSLIPTDILGQVYEQFLGKVIRLTAGHHAVVEDKPEVKKAGGVYYTPTYIVEYIVKHTVGALLEGKKPGDKGVGRGESLRILDPACGSGSFLLGAYQYLLDWYRDGYIADGAEKWARGAHPRLVQTSSPGGGLPQGEERAGGFILTTAERKRILLEHIYGVDIDPQAVEVTKLSLLLKVLEGESEGSLARQLSLWQERALPDLGKNIQCGNSLIGSDFYQGKTKPLGSAETLKVFDVEEQFRINAFDWQKAFPEVFRDEGFDVVIGNPPYIRIQALKEWAPQEVEFYKQRYSSASKGNYDIYVVFVEKGLSLLNEHGRLGFILPHKFFNAQYGHPLRELLARGKNLSKVVHFGDQQVFKNATTYTCLMFLDKAGREVVDFEKVNDLEAWRENRPLESSATQKSSIAGTISAAIVTPAEWNFTVGRGAGLFEKLSRMPVKLGDVALLFVGLQTDADDVFILEEVKTEGNRILCASKATNKQHWFENEHLKPLLKGSLNIRRYHLTDVKKLLIFPYELKDEKSFLIDIKQYQMRFPLTWAYLEQNHDCLAARNKKQMGKDWYGYVYKKNHTRFGFKKLVVPSIATGSCFSADLDGIYYFTGSGGGGGGGYGIQLFTENGISYLYLLGLTNSHLLSFYLKLISTPFRGGYIALNRQYIEQLPIRPIDFSSPSDVQQHDHMVALVERMLALHKQLAAANTPNEKTMLQRQIDATDQEIDRLVYELYELTEEEIKIVEAN
jgi:predicted type IV restriction endonuclease